MSTTTDNDPLTVLTAAFWGPLPESPVGGVDADQLARKALRALQDAGFTVVPERLLNGMP